MLLRLIISVLPDILFSFINCRLQGSEKWKKLSKFIQLLGIDTRIQIWFKSGSGSFVPDSGKMVYAIPWTVADTQKGIC